MKTPKLKWIMFIIGIAFIWVGAGMFLEDSIKAIAAWVTSGLCLIVSLVMAIEDNEKKPKE